MKVKRNSGKWTEARFNSFITSALRAASRRWGPRYEALKRAFTSRKTNRKTGRMAKHYRCNKCFKEFTSIDVQVDHIDPVVNPYIGFQSWDVYIERMFCEVSGYQVLCKDCHKVKSDREKLINKNRKQNEK